MVDMSVPDRIPNELRQCRECEVAPGALHVPGCDLERCHHWWPEEYWVQLMAAGASLRRQWVSCDACRAEECARNGHDFRAAECYWCGTGTPA